jgi:hypothetical protein
MARGAGAGTVRRGIQRRRGRWRRRRRRGRGRMKGSRTRRRRAALAEAMMPAIVAPARATFSCFLW